MELSIYHWCQFGWPWTALNSEIVATCSCHPRQCHRSIVRPRCNVAGLHTKEGVDIDHAITRCFGHSRLSWLSFHQFVLQLQDAYGGPNQRLFTITDISNLNCWYQQFELEISTIIIADITNSKWTTYSSNWNCWYQQFKLLISLIIIADINNNTTADISNSNCW